MNIRHELLRRAGKLASSQTARRIQLAADIGQLEGRLSLSKADSAELESMRAEEENSRQALTRFGVYRPYQEAEPNCPHCWIIRGIGHPLRIDPSSDSCRCEKCGSDYP